MGSTSTSTSAPYRRNQSAAHAEAPSRRASPADIVSTHKGVAAPAKLIAATGAFTETGNVSARVNIAEGSEDHQPDREIGEEEEEWEKGGDDSDKSERTHWTHTHVDTLHRGTNARDSDRRNSFNEVPRS